MPLEIVIPETELFDEKTNTFINVSKTTLKLEHSLVSISKWESKWKKPFLGKEQKTQEESTDYIKCMTITQNVDPFIYSVIPSSEINKITEYINDPMTATTFNNKQKAPKKNTVITAEIVYYWMTELNIPFSCEKWHFNRLLTLIEVCNVKKTPPKKMNKRDILSRNAALNAARRQATGSTG